ncbi:dipeptide epimerase [Rhodanobacter sp. UC4436_H3]
MPNQTPAALNVRVNVESWPLREPFTISRRTFTASLVATANVYDLEGNVGNGECEPHEWSEAAALDLVAQVGLVPGSTQCPSWAEGLTRDTLGQRLSRSPMRNAIDCALWDLESKATGKPAHVLAGLSWQAVPVMATLGIDTPEIMARAASRHQGARWLKVKVGSNDGQDALRIEAVAAAVPGTDLLLDANAGWSPSVLASLLPLCQRSGVRIIEQPLPPLQDEDMPKPVSDILFCADESCLDRASMPVVRKHFQYINIKLDKTGGLTEALALRAEAERSGLGVMVGMMSGSSLAVAPAFLLAQGLDVVDLELGFMLRDREPPMHIENAFLQPPSRHLWG